MKQVSKKQKVENENLSMSIVHARCAGIDVGDSEHVVALGPELFAERTRSFGAMTRDIEALADWLLSYQITSVAMESTGVYWKPLFSLPVSKGIEVYLVNAAHVKNVTGRKDDENDAMWIQKLHSCGLLNSSYLPDAEQESLRTLVRFKGVLTQDSSRFVNRIQKSLELMNIKFHTVIRDITGMSGLAVLQAIINGERNPENFLPLMDYRIKAGKEAIVESLRGTWKEEHLFTLAQSLDMYQLYRAKIEACDSEIEKHLQKLEARENNGEIQLDKQALVVAKKKTRQPRCVIRIRPRYL